MKEAQLKVLLAETRAALRLLFALEPNFVGMETAENLCSAPSLAGTWKAFQQICREESGGGRLSQSG